MPQIEIIAHTLAKRKKHRILIITKKTNVSVFDLHIQIIMFIFVLISTFAGWLSGEAH